MKNIFNFFLAVTVLSLFVPSIMMGYSPKGHKSGLHICRSKLIPSINNNGQGASYRKFNGKKVPKKRNNIGGYFSFKISESNKGVASGSLRFIIAGDTTVSSNTLKCPDLAIRAQKGESIFCVGTIAPTLKSNSVLGDVYHIKTTELLDSLDLNYTKVETRKGKNDYAIAFQMIFEPTGKTTPKEGSPLYVSKSFFGTSDHNCSF